MLGFQIEKRAGWTVLFFAAGLGSLLAATPVQAVTPAEADTAFNALNKVYWDQESRYFSKDEQGTEKANFWFEAQLWDMVMDQYDRTGSAEVKRQINDVYDGFVKKYPNWTTNKYNDDIMWWAIACGRAYKITGDERYLKKSKASFDFVYDNFLDKAHDGGLFWTSDKTSSNSCVNCPGIIAAARLSVFLKDDAYLEKAKSLYAWQKKTLTDGTGRILDNIHYDKNKQTSRLAKVALTYNQGTYIGAAVLLYKQTNDKAYLDDAIKTAKWTKANLCVTAQRILRSEGQGDGGAFKGIFVRYMKLFIDECDQKQFLPWMKANADAAWRNRRPGDNIMGNNWTAPTGAGIQSQTAASAVAVVLCFADDESKK